MRTVEHYELIRRKVLLEGLSQRDTAQALGHSRKTVAKALALLLPPGYRLGEPRPRPVLEPVQGIIDAWLEQNRIARHPKQRQTAQRIYERLRAEYGFTGHYGTVQRYVQEATHRQKEVFMPLEFEPGQEAQVDWHEGWIFENGVERKCQFFVMKLCYSKAMFVHPYEKANLESFLDGHVRAFEYFEGSCDELIPDNLKSAVTTPSFYDPVLNPTYEEMAAHYGTAVLPARIRRPRDKAKVEAGVLLVTRWILARLRNRIFFSLAELNEEIRRLLEALNSRPFRKMEGSRKSLFETMEKPALKALPERPFEYGEWKKATVNIDYHIDVTGHYYSVPYTLRGYEVDVRFNAATVEIFHQGKRVASHARSFLKGRHTTLQEHLPPSHREYKEWLSSQIV